MAKHQSAPERMQWCGWIPPQSSESCDQDFVHTSWLGHAVPPIHRWLFEGGRDGDPATWQQTLWVASGAAVAVAADADAARVERSVCGGGEQHSPKAADAELVESRVCAGGEMHRSVAMHQSAPERTRQCGWIPLYMTGYHQDLIYMRHAALSFHRWLLNGGRVRDRAARQQAFWVQPGDAAEARASTALIARASTVLAVALRDA